MTQKDVALWFIAQLFYDAMAEFNTDYSTISNALDKLGYWDIFDDDNVVCVGAHDGTRPILERLRSII